MGIVGAAVSVYLARRTAAIRSTQSATGILYITTIFVLFGELASLDDGGARVDRLICLAAAMLGSAAFRRRRLSRTAGSITIDERRIAGPCVRTGCRPAIRGTDGPMELTFACPICGLVGRVAALETADRAVCRGCGTVQPLHAEAIAQSRLEACPCCLTTDLYVQKDFPQWLGLLIVIAQFAISTVFWYYEMADRDLRGPARLRPSSTGRCIPACPT